MLIKKIYLLYHCEYINLPYIPALNEFSEKKHSLAGRFHSRGIFVTLCVLCNLMYPAYFLYALH